MFVRESRAWVCLNLPKVENNKKKSHFQKKFSIDPPGSGWLQKLALKYDY